MLLPLTSRNKIKEGIVMFTIQVFSYAIMCINYRAVAMAHYHQAAITDFTIAAINFLVIRKIAKSEEAMHQWFGYVLGSVAGSYLGIYLSVIFNAK